MGIILLNERAMFANSEMTKSKPEQLIGTIPPNREGSIHRRRRTAGSPAPRYAASMKMLPRLLSSWNIASRKAAEAMVACGRVRVNGRVVRDVCASFPESARVEVDGVVVGPRRDAPTWYAVNKPRGVVSTTADPEGRPTVLGLVPSEPRVAPVGRLDLDSAGLLLLTNEHALSAKLLDPASHVRKRYRVKVEGHLDATALATLAAPAELDGERLGAMEVEVESENPRSTWVRVTLAEGKNRQIRRRMDAVGHPVQLLIRDQFGPIALGTLAPGACRTLTEAERAALVAAV
jgi:23S rRNA pseudouridine2605 synthase